DDAIDDAGLASAVIINVHARARLDPRGLDLSARPVQETDCLAQRITDWTVRAVPPDDDGLARLKCRDGTIGGCRRSSGFSRARYRVLLGSGRLRCGCACLRESKRRDRRASQNEDALFHNISLQF